MTREQLAWAAGLWEGEGCFSIRHNPTSLRATLATTDQDIAIRLQAILGFGQVLAFQPTHLRGAKIQYRYHVQNKDTVYALAVLLFTFLGARRREKIKEVVSVYRTMKGRWPQEEG